jgi:predicted RNase H-like HicB family nuclease
LDEAYANARDALAAVVELYEDDNRTLPPGVAVILESEPIYTDALVEAA